MKTWSIYIIVAAFALAGCSDEIPDTPVVPPVPPAEDGTVALTIQFPSSSAPSTYAITDTEENEINNLFVLSFVHNGSSLLEDKLAYKPIKVTTAVEDSVSNIKKVVRVKVKNMIEKQRLALIANVPSDIETYLLSLTEGTTMETIVDALTFSGSDWRAGQDVANFPMFGQMTDSVQFHSQNTTPTTKFTFNMIRAVARVDVGVDIHGTGDPALGFGSIFKIEKVYVRNASEGGYIAPDKSYLKYVSGLTPPDPDIHDGDTIINKVNLITGDNRVAFDVSFPTSGNMLERSIYIPESDTLQTGYTPAFLVVQATYYGTTYYYRIDFTDRSNNKYVPVLRNHNYVFNITGVRTEGYTSLAQAVNAPVSKFGMLELLDEGETHDIGLKEVWYTDDYYLAVSSTYIEVSQEVQYVRIYIKSTFTNGAWETVGKTWPADAPDQISKSPGAGVLDWLTLSTGANYTDAPIIHSVKIKSGMLTTPTITIVQRPGSNSYITKPNGVPGPAPGATVPVTIPVKSADIDGVPRSIPFTYSGTGTPPAAEYDLVTLWQTSDVIPLYDKINAQSFDVYSTGPGEGSFVVAMKSKATGKILYSWHIWVTAYDPNDPATQKSNNGFIFMDRNLGATENTTNAASYGLYYQWGRKDPFAPGVSPAFGVDTINAYTNNLELSIQHPDTFYAVPYTTPYDWIGTGQNNNLWSTSDGKKSPYDPCPFGWRVPVVKDDDSGSPWYRIGSSSGNGIVHPLAGYLNAFSGVRDDANVEGGVWGASARGQQAFAFKFTGGSFITPRSAFRAYAYPVRCVKDTR